MKFPCIINQVRVKPCVAVFCSLFWCVSAQVHSDIGNQSQQMRTFVYDCESGHSFIVNFKNDEAWIFLPMQTVALDHVPSGSGTKYSNGAITYWSKGDEAVLDTPDTQYRGCKNNRAKAVWEDAKFRGVDFRAIGNEPGWFLEISEKTKLLFVNDYGQSRFEFILSEPVTDQAARQTTYTAKSNQQPITVIIEGRVCHDTMSGEQFESTVSVQFNDREYSGCGRALH